MECPNCSGENTELDTRQDECTVIFEGFECNDCGSLFTLKYKRERIYDADMNYTLKFIFQEMEIDREGFEEPTPAREVWESESEGWST
jgi:transposase-like protein